MKGKLLAGLTTGLFVFVLAGLANATTLTSTISMDNGYSVYLSTSDTVQGTVFGSANNWPAAHTHSTTLTPGTDYFLHVYGYDQGGPAGFLGEFALSGTDHSFVNNTTWLLTNTTDWQGNNTGWGQSFSALTDWGVHGVSPWGTIGGIDSAARWIWFGDNNSNDIAYFSTKISASPVPVPAALILFGSGLAGLVGIRRTKENHI